MSVILLVHVRTRPQARRLIYSDVGRWTVSGNVFSDSDDNAYCVYESGEEYRGRLSCFIESSIYSRCDITCIRDKVHSEAQTDP